jgi:hypothetical protein
MRSAVRHVARLVPVPRSVKPRLLDLSECPHCCSRYVQPTEGTALRDGKVALTLRCPDCLAWMSGTFSAERVRELDRQLATGRAALRDSYERMVTRNMAQELRALSAGLAMDLIGAEDFTPLRGGARTTPTSS